VKTLSRDLPWVDSVYTNTSGFIHLSDRHFYVTLDENKKTDDALEIQIRISATEQALPEEKFFEVTGAYLECTRLIVSYLQAWVARDKERSEKAAH